jgi:hypothetical protein
MANLFYFKAVLAAPRPAQPMPADIAGALQ